MLVWENFTFAGIVPRLRKKHLPAGYATAAHDVDLTHGSLKPFREPLHITNRTAGDTALYAWGCGVYSWRGCVNVAEWLPDCPRLFITGNADYPQTATENKGRLTYRRLGVVAPDTPPLAQAQNVDSDKSRATAYTITFVNGFGEESAPSLPSNEVVVEDGAEVVLSFHYAPPIEYDIHKLRIYRRETGFREGMEKEQEFVTHWFFLAELDITARGYTDTTPIKKLGWAVETLETREPPAALRNITALSGTAILAGSAKNKLLFSRNLQPHNWELGQEMTLDDNIIALGSLGGSLYVATDGHPYRVQGDVGCDARECREIYRYTQAMPMINCHTGNGAVVTPHGFIYASVDGLVLLSDTPTAQIITSEVLSADDWRELAPHTARLAYHRGALFVVTDLISFILWLDNNAYADTKHKKMVTFSDIPVAMAATRQGELLMMNADGGVYQWNAGENYRPYKWVSATIDTGFYFDLTRVRTKVSKFGVAVTKESQRGETTRNYPAGDTIIPFHRHGRQREFNIRLEGIGEVTELVAGVSEIDMASKE